MELRRLTIGRLCDRSRLDSEVAKQPSLFSPSGAVQLFCFTSKRAHSSTKDFLDSSGTWYIDMEFVSDLEEITRLDDALNQLNAREAWLKKQLIDVNEERDALSIVRGLAAASLAPINRLPHEILAQIFNFGTFGCV